MNFFNLKGLNGGSLGKDVHLDTETGQFLSALCFCHHGQPQGHACACA